MIEHRPKRRLTIMISLAMVLAACGSSGADEAVTTSTAGVGDVLDGAVVTVFGAIVDTDAANFEASIAPFEEATGIDVQYEGSGDFESLVTIRVEAGDAPDLGLFPQPGLLADFARSGDLVALDDLAVADLVDENYIDSWKTLGTVDDNLYGVWYRAVVKSLVWYPVSAFEEGGYEIPTTWDEMLALSRDIAESGTTPWCIGVESAGATGWVVTDWIEELMLRIYGPDVYDQWVDHEIPFTDPSVLEAVETFGEIALDPDLVLGGTTAILTTPFGDAMNPMLDDDPGCLMHRNGSFMPAFLPEDTSFGPDGQINVFYLPPVNDQFEDPVLGGGDVVGMFNDRPEVRAFLEYLATPESGEIWAGSGGYLSPHSGFDTSTYVDDFTRQIGDILAETSTFRFDASDLMPGSVGAGAFWTGMVDWVTGEDAEAVLADIESSWPDE